MEDIKELIKKKTDFNEIKAVLLKAGELVNYEVTDTPSEDKFGNKLLENNIKVIPQFKMDDYTYDFKIYNYPILIEIDGKVHRKQQKIEKDYMKWRYAVKKGFILIRFTNKEACSDYAVEEVKSVIKNCTRQPREIWLYQYTFWDWLKDKFRKR